MKDYKTGEQVPLMTADDKYVLKGIGLAFVASTIGVLIVNHFKEPTMKTEFNASFAEAAPVIEPLLANSIMTFEAH